MPRLHPAWMAQTVAFSASEICKQTPRPECLLASWAEHPRVASLTDGAPACNGPGPWALAQEAAARRWQCRPHQCTHQGESLKAVCHLHSSLGLQKDRQGSSRDSGHLFWFWWEAACFLCFAEEIGLKLGSPCFPKLSNILIKIFLLPHQHFFYASVWWQAAESYSVR